MEYSLSGFLSKLALNKLGSTTNWKNIFQAIFPISFAAKCVKLGLWRVGMYKSQAQSFFQAQRISKIGVLVPRDKDGYSQFLWFKLFQVSYF